MRKLAFIHAPKTAGTSFTRALARGWPRRRGFASREGSAGLSPAELGQLDMVAGHFHAFHMEKPAFADFVRVTLVRDPFDRLISSWHFGRDQVAAGAQAGPGMRLAA